MLGFVKFILAVIMLTWWLQADIHFNDDDYFQQNLQLTLEAMAMDIEENIVSLTMHEEIANDLTVILMGQISTWLTHSMVKIAVYTTGKGDIFFRILFATEARTFLLAEEAGRVLKSKLEYGIYTQFGLCLSSKLVSVTLLATVNPSENLPVLSPVNGKQLVLIISTEENNFTDEELMNNLEKEYCQLEDYSTREVDEMMDTFDSEVTLTSPSSNDAMSDSDNMYSGF